MDLRKSLIRTLILIYNTELGNQETLEDYLGIYSSEMCHTICSWKAILIENKNYLSKRVMWEQDKVKTQ